MLNPNLASKISYERILNNFQNEAVNRSGVLRVCWLVPILKTVDFEDSEFVFDWLPNSENGRFGRFGNFWEILVFICETLKTKRIRSCWYGNWVISVFVAKQRTRLHVFRLETSFFARMNLKPAVLKNFVFDWALCFRLCEVYRFQNLVGFELPIKHAPKQLMWAFPDLSFEYQPHTLYPQSTRRFKSFDSPISSYFPHEQFQLRCPSKKHEHLCSLQ